MRSAFRSRVVLFAARRGAVGGLSLVFAPRTALGAEAEEQPLLCCSVQDVDDVLLEPRALASLR